ncbi:MAG: hypothetical protein H6713_28850 [Myxococcales bacterium]|nr:hypothetical protein [Myxococcales bacterium]
MLIDDDLVSGETLARVRRALPERCRLVGAEFQRRLDMPDKSCTRDDPGDDARVVDLCDARDFLVGAREGGLVVELPDGQLARAPYLLPYVRPGARVSLPRASELEFSRALWTANLAFFRRVATLRVQDASAAFQRLARYLGFADETPLRDLCQWHVDRLAGSTDAAREDR